MFPLRSHLIERSVAIVCVLSICLGVAVAQSLSLEPNNAIEREIGAGETHSFTLNLTAGQYAHVVVDQRGVDVVVSIFAPNGTKVAQVDMPNGNSGPEPVSLMAETTGAYRVDVLSTSTTSRSLRSETRRRTRRNRIGSQTHQRPGTLH